MSLFFPLVHFPCYGINSQFKVDAFFKRCQKQVWHTNKIGKMIRKAARQVIILSEIIFELTSHVIFKLDDNLFDSWHYVFLYARFFSQTPA